MNLVFSEFILSLKKAENNTGESIVPDSDPYSSDIEVSSMGSSDVSSDFGEEWDNNEPNTVNDATVTANTNIPNWTTYFADITTQSFTQENGPCLPENFDVSVAGALDYSTYYSSQKYLVT